MNIFALSRNVKACARFHCDQHVVKMPVETAQLLSTALHCHDQERWAELNASGLAYKPTHFNHPCAVWARECVNNYLWLGALGRELCAEYWFRFARERQRTHKSATVLDALIANAPRLPRLPCITPFPMVMPQEYVVGHDPVASYRNYYRLHKASFARYTGREVPDWMNAPD